MQHLVSIVTDIIIMYNIEDNDLHRQFYYNVAYKC